MLLTLPHSALHRPWSSLGTAALRSADSLIRSITWRYRCYDAALVLNDIPLPSTGKRTRRIVPTRTTDRETYRWPNGATRGLLITEYA